MFDFDMIGQADLKTDAVYSKMNDVAQIKLTFLREVKQRQYIPGGKYTKKQIEGLNQSMWWTCTIFGDYADVLNTKGLKAGQMLIIKGKLYGNRWIGKDDNLQKSSWFTRTGEVRIMHDKINIELIVPPARKKREKTLKPGVPVPDDELPEVEDAGPDTVISGLEVSDDEVNRTVAQTITKIRGKLTPT